MRLYEGNSQQFVEDTIQNQIADKLKDAYEDYYGKRINRGELTSWINSL